ncbi:hypothetical protein LMG27198_28200 [Methylocystis echinoides]|uniref:Uncharacterized protein n=1 Tax=Methylocystis echinoides TaxID=29468 RepID=A0A9W6GVR7_9HYPH|nr:hypothetical protein LMG27198_28200 [Methylocystis echinoides]
MQKVLFGTMAPESQIFMILVSTQRLPPMHLVPRGQAPSPAETLQGTLFGRGGAQPPSGVHTCPGSQ